jgi:hypothetical protein
MSLSSLPEFPKPLSPPIPLGDPNTPIPLYAGPIDFTQGNKTFRAEASISLAWLPAPRVRFDIPTLPTGVFPTLDNLSLRLTDGTVISRGRMTGVKHSSGQKGDRASLSGIIAERVVRPADAEATYALFLLPNFEAPGGRPLAYSDGSSRAARLVLVGSGWKVTLDEVDNEKAVRQVLNARSGFGVTQIGRLEREDGRPFKTEDAIPILNGLAWYVSFACGRWTGPCLPRGFAADGKLLWEVWDCSRIVPDSKRLSWMDTGHAGQFEIPFPGFLKLWLDEAWEEAIRVGIHWYIEANAQAGSIEGSIVLTQAAFELLSSAVLVENYGLLSADAYEKLAAADRIRRLFLWAGLPIAIPTELDNLTRVAKADNWPDTSTAMTRIRNTITHPTRKNREKFGKHPTQARTETWTLGLWSLELCLLRLFEYRGTYASRLKFRYSGEVVPVPWTVPVSI